MYQIDVATAAPALPPPAAPGTPGYFTDGDLVGGVDPTILPAEFLNAVMLELLGVLSAAGIAPSKTQNGQLATAIGHIVEAKSGNYAADTGVANAYVVALSPPVTAYTNGLQVKFRVAHANTGTSTLDAGAGPAPFLRDDGTPAVRGDFPANAIVTAIFDAAAGAFLAGSIVLSQLGALAQLNIGAGLANDGNGNLALAGQAFASGNFNVGSGLVYLVDTRTGPIAGLLPANPTLGFAATFIDAAATWAANNFTLLHNGRNIQGRAEDLAANISDVQFSIWFNGTEWRLV